MKNITILLLLAALCGCYARDPLKTGREGKLLPDFDMLLSDSTTYLHSKNIPGGRPIVFFYFGPHCPYSREQMKEIIEDMEKLQHIRFYLLTDASYAEMKAFCKVYTLDKYPNITVGRDYTGFFKDYFEVAGVPYVAVYGKDRHLREAFMGKVYGGQLKRSTDE
ncbi:TlpA family protein disulfide reductase [Chitinophaga japonensis]|uniref:AhpC/TSA family protein n=1 Tax=Chitinophaga japonensis TaxID=104662 RepID=A0A562SZI5_CHIJA|nr:redoxin domain-containing protein [Chitinophaga japonensis]TWI86681.1 AhpC/TSA family protein [Chitinophaga japonensis]